MPFPAEALRRFRASYQPPSISNAYFQAQANIEALRAVVTTVAGATAHAKCETRNERRTGRTITPYIEEPWAEPFTPTDAPPCAAAAPSSASPAFAFAPPTASPAVDIAPSA